MYVYDVGLREMPVPVLRDAEVHLLEHVGPFLAEPRIAQLAADVVAEEQPKTMLGIIAAAAELAANPHAHIDLKFARAERIRSVRRVEQLQRARSFVRQTLPLGVHPDAANLDRTSGPAA